MYKNLEDVYLYVLGYHVSMEVLKSFQWWMVPLALFLVFLILAFLIGISPNDLIPHVYNVN